MKYIHLYNSTKIKERDKDSNDMDEESKVMIFRGSEVKIIL